MSARKADMKRWTRAHESATSALDMLALSDFGGDAVSNMESLTAAVQALGDLLRVVTAQKRKDAARANRVQWVDCGNIDLGFVARCRE